MEGNLLFKEESYNIIGAAMEVHRVLGCGFTEPVYQEAFEKELTLRQIPFEREKVLPVFYKDVLLDKHFRVDFVCYDSIIVELKAVQGILDEHYQQVYNYLKAGKFTLGILLNFGAVSLEHKRIPCLTKWEGIRSLN